MGISVQPLVSFGPLVLTARDDTIVMDDGRPTFFVAAGLRQLPPTLRGNRARGTKP